MDCCNYMQYRHHQPYYGNQYYDSLLPSYHGDFYGNSSATIGNHHQQMYPEYYNNNNNIGNSPYYPQQWPCAASFPDYVYNPKEARIRKAMRDATRERSIGTSPMLPRPNARRSTTSSTSAAATPHSWVSPHDELLMSPQSMGGMRGGAMCPPPFSMSSTASNQFMASGGGVNNGYNAKMETAASSNYMQSNPLAQLQQHTEMWPDYQNIRPRSSAGNPYMMGDVVYSAAAAVAAQQGPSPASANLTSPPPSAAQMMMDKAQMTPPPTTTATPSNSGEIITANEPDKAHHHDLMDGNHATTTCAPTTNTSNNVSGGGGHCVESTQDHFMHSVFEHQQGNGDAARQHYEKIEESTSAMNHQQQQIRSNTKKMTATNNNKPLPDFNEAFGSTERGRFQSPPDPRLAPNNKSCYLDYFFESTASIKFDDYQI